MDARIGSFDPPCSRLGLLEKEYIRAGNEGMVSPLTRFLEGEMKNIMRERKILENKRLDLDACKNRVRKARGMLDQPPVRNFPVDINPRADGSPRMLEVQMLLTERIY